MQIKSQRERRAGRETDGQTDRQNHTPKKKRDARKYKHKHKAHEFVSVL